MKRAKRGLDLFNWLFIILVFIGFFIPLVSAQYGGYYGDPFSTAQDITTQISRAMLGFLDPFLHFAVGDYDSGEFFYTKVLLLLLFFIIISGILRKIPQFEGGNIAIPTVVALIVSIISIRYMSENTVVSSLLLPYGAMGIAMMTIIPTAIYFFGMHYFNFSPMMRKFGGWLYLIAFFLLWSYRGPSYETLENSFYIWVTIAMILMLIFDKSVHKFFREQSAQEAIRNANLASIVRLQNEYNNIAGLRTGEAESRRKWLRKEIKKLGADI